MSGRRLSVVAVVLWSFSSCVTDHDQLAKQGDTGSTTTGGLVSSGGMGGTAPRLDTTSSGGSFGGGMTTGPTFEFDADGPDELTLIHGQVDAEKIAFCFAPIEDGVRGDPDGDPFPEGGLEFGSYVTTNQPGGLSFENDAMVPIVLAGDLDRIDGDDCVEALDRADWVESTLGVGGAAGASAIDDGVYAMALPQLPRGSLTLGRRYLLAVVGCMTLPAQGGSDYEDLCGVPREPHVPTLVPVLATVSRATRTDRMGLQTLHASAGSDPITLEVVASSVGNATPIRMASDLVFGELYPPTPNLNVSADEFGVRTGGNVHVLQGGRRELQVPWVELMDQAGIDELVDGETYTLVLLGPHAGTEQGGGYQGSRLTLIHTSELLSGE